MQEEEEERYLQIIKDSNRKLVVLELLSNFFNHKDLVGILVRTKIIHTLFEKNRILDINKLELFHIQFTSSLIDLFQKIKKSKEQQYVLISDEIYINEDILSKLKQEIGESKFAKQMQLHAQNMSKKIEELYELFVSEKDVFFNWNDIMIFSQSIQAEYYREITIDQYEKLSQLNKSVYENPYAKFEKKLLGRLNILNFKIKFLCGLVCNNEIIEVYEFRDSNDKFVFVANEKSFYFLNEENTKDIDISKNGSAKEEIIIDLKNKNAELKRELSVVKTTLPENVLEVLKEYHDKISSVDFLEELQNVDEQTNILKTMLNININ
ncbi:MULTISPECIES: hypothetical protein [Flavobacterium]|uniref:Uncharacterized protein n=2 Tax=Flavobacterium TaxID=237 RepID=A0A6V6Z5M8_9FLAO|nr:MULTISPECIES: hypothetical protein [Flavobacterium]OOV17064.1 hypothetical protein BXU10_19125 [Flavobacterium sp. LM4]CAD0003364.1 hypothetical protein FLAT13_01647 [Flavobacterium salmonis]CAD0006886.1 hypothetical protein FLACHUCJ7_03049 [Flavobacterium chungangense]